MMSLNTAVEGHSIVPDVLSTLPPHVKTLDVVYAGQRLVSGMDLPRKNTLTKPEIYFEDGQPGQTYILLMVDPDLFKRNDPTGQVRHWFEEVSFVSTSDSSISRTTKVLTNYMPCTPGAGSGKHRYVFLLCEKPGDVTIDAISKGFISPHAPNEDLKDRMGFNVDQFIVFHHLDVVGINFMLVSADIQSAAENLAAGVKSAVHKLEGE